MKKSKLMFAVLFVIISGIAGCGLSAKLVEENKTNNEDYASEQFIQLYQKVYLQVLDEYEPVTIERLKRVIEKLGQNGYVAVDSKNQIDMVNYERLLDFIKGVDKGEKGNIEVICVIENGNLIRYDFCSDGEGVKVRREYFVWNSGSLISSSKNEYEAYTWLYTEEGYLFVEEYHMPGFDGPSGHTAFRVLPLSETCRELNRRYILPVGYAWNNMFIRDWGKNDFGKLDFYDLFDLFYPMLYGQEHPYIAEENLSEGAIYHIPKDEFERVIQEHIDIDSETLRKYARFYSEDQSYEYRPRGFYDNEQPIYPFPEVVKYSGNEDGTLSLTVRAVFPYQNLANVFEHEVVIRPFQNGKYQYVSNHVITSESNSDFLWHVDRLTDEEWIKAYGEPDKVNPKSILEKEHDFTIDRNMEEQIETECKKVMNSIREIYDAADHGIAINPVIDRETVEKMEEKLSNTGIPIYSTGFYLNMKNYSVFEKFLYDVMDGKRNESEIIEILSNGGICIRYFIFDGTDMYVLAVIGAWDKQNEPMIVYTDFSPIKNWEFTEKGWFSFEYCVPEPPEISDRIMGNILIRVKPLPEENLEIAAKYLMPIGYQGNNLFLSNWDYHHLDELDYNGLFDSLYLIKNQTKFDEKQYVEGIPEKEFEDLIMSFLPVTREEIIQYADYDENTGTYIWKKIGCDRGLTTLFGCSIPEITDIIRNSDGTVTLRVDAVCAPLGTDIAMSHDLIVKFTVDGKIRYLKNTIRENNMQGSLEYHFRVR